MIVKNFSPEYMSGYLTPYFFLAPPTLKDNHMFTANAPVEAYNVSIQLFSIKL